MGQKMRVVIIEPDKPAHIAEIENSLASMQATVGGYIEIVPAEWMPGGAILRNRNLLLVMNEEGKLEDLEPNFPLQNGSDYLFGTAFVCKGQEDEMVGLSEEEADLIVGLFERKENVNG